MVPSIFSRRSAPEPEATPASSTSTHPTTLVGSARTAWRTRLEETIAADSKNLPTLSLTEAHPGSGDDQAVADDELGAVGCDEARR